MLANRTKKISPSPTLAVTAKAKALKAQGIDVVGFGAGEPDFDTPTFVKEAAKKALDSGFTKYTPSSGILELKKAICEKLQKENGLTYDVTQILVSNGAKHCLFNALYALVNPGEEVILLSPYWVSYAEMVNLCDGVNVLVDTNEDNGFVPDIEAIKKAVTSKTKVIILNSPCNPTGAVFNEKLLKEVSELAVKNNFYIIADEIYEKLIYAGEKHISIAGFSEEVYKKTITINGVSKCYAMTGWRIGYAAAPKEIIKAMSEIQDHTTSCPNSIAQKAALAAYIGDQSEVAKMQQAFERRKNLIVSELKKIPNIKVAEPKGAFYVYPNVRNYLGKFFKDKKINTVDEMAIYLLEDFKAAVVPGSAFGTKEHIRLSYAISEEDIVKGVARIKEGLEALK